MHALPVRIIMISFVALTSFLSTLPAAGIARTPVVVSQALPPFSGRVYLPIQARGEATSIELTLPEVITLPVETPVVATPEAPKKTYARLPMEDDYHSQVTETRTKNACGPTSLLMVLEYDLKESLDKVIKKARFSPSEGGFDPTCQENPACMSPAALEKLAREAYSLAVDGREGWTLDDVFAALDAGSPVIADIAWQGKAAGIGHFVVIYGVDLAEKTVYYHDPFEGAARQASWDEFAASWNGPVDVGDPLLPAGHQSWGMAIAR